MSTLQIGLGPFLQAARRNKKLTLRAVEQATGVSNAYLSQLESGKIQKPSPITLHKLSDIYGVSYADLLSLAGYPLPFAIQDSNKSGLATRVGPVTEDEEESLIEYLQFLRSRHKRSGRK
jgi:HTH-type transcriptional regulator, competence development regulator